jgi:phospholipase C
MNAVAAAVLAFAVAGCDTGSSTLSKGPDQSVASLQAKVNHVIVIYQENWSFDALYGKFPGANGLQNATAATIAQVYCRPGTTAYVPLTALPAAFTAAPAANGCQWNASAGTADARIPAGLPVGPYDLNQYVPPTADTGDVIHRFWHEQLQIDNGVLEPAGAGGAYSMDKSVTWSDNQGLAFSYYDATNLPEGQLAQQYTMADNTFQSAYGGSYLNHQWLVCACTPQWLQALPASNPNALSSWDAATKTLNDGFLSHVPIGSSGAIYGINTMYTANAPHPASAPADQLAQPYTNATIGDRLTDATPSISWKWYAGGWDAALAGTPDPTFQFHHQPFAYYQRWGLDGSPNKAAHLQDEQKFLADLQGGTLPNVAFIKPLGVNNEHPGYADLATGQNHVQALVQAVKQSPYWKDSVIIITYDENGGRWDHVSPPPTTDGWGPGHRVPTIVISPFARRRYVDHTKYETVSILKLIETRWNLQPLGSRDAAAGNLLNAFDFSQTSLQ